MIIPRKLVPGDRVAIIGPSSPVDRERLEPTEKAVRDLGLEPVMFESARSTWGFLAGSDALRASDVMEAFCDDSIAGIWCIRGGYGAQRLLDKLDYAEIAKHPKFFGGYSDITALHAVLNQKCGMMTWHMPMPSRLPDGNSPDAPDDYTMDQIRRALFGSLAGRVELPAGKVLRKLKGGKAAGQLVGGNLSLVVSSIGTPYELDTKGKILFLEEVHEAPYGIDGMLQQMKAAGKLKDAVGIILGYYTDAVPLDPERNLSLEQIFLDHVASQGVPVVMGLPCGHSLPTVCLPLGADAVLDADAGVLTLGEDNA